MCSRTIGRLKSITPSQTSIAFDIESQQAPLTDKPLQLKKYIYGGQAFRGPSRGLSRTILMPRQTRAWLRKERSCSLAKEKSSGRKPYSYQLGRNLWRASIRCRELIHDAKEASTLIVLSHRENFRSPQSVRLHPTKPYFCFSPCVDAPFTIEKPNNYVSKYRYLLTSNAIDPEWIDAQWMHGTQLK